MTFIAPGSPTAAQGTWLGPGPNTVPASPGFYAPCTAPPHFQTSANALVAANQAVYWRSMGVGWISSICLQVATQSGNICVGIYQAPSGSPNSNQYLQSFNRVATSGMVPCPSGPAQIPITPSPIFVNLNSYFAMIADNTTATFFSFGGGWGGGYGPINSYATGLCLVDTTSGTPLPPSPVLNSGARGVTILLTGA